MNDPMCKQLEGIESKTEKEQHEAVKCYVQCLFEERNLFVDGNLINNEIIDFNEEYLNDRGDAGADFMEISKNSTISCLDECESI